MNDNRPPWTRNSKDLDFINFVTGKKTDDTTIKARVRGPTTPRPSSSSAPCFGKENDVAGLFEAGQSVAGLFEAWKTSIAKIQKERDEATPKGSSVLEYRTAASSEKLQDVDDERAVARLKNSGVAPDHEPRARRPSSQAATAGEHGPEREHVSRAPEPDRAATFDADGDAEISAVTAVGSAHLLPQDNEDDNKRSHLSEGEHRPLSQAKTGVSAATSFLDATEETNIGEATDKKQVRWQQASKQASAEKGSKQVRRQDVIEKKYVSRAPEHDKAAAFHADGSGEVGAVTVTSSSDQFPVQNDDDDKRSPMRMPISGGDYDPHSSWAGAAISAAASFLDATEETSTGAATDKKQETGSKQVVRGKVRHSLVRFEEGRDRAGAVP